MTFTKLIAFFYLFFSATQLFSFNFKKDLTQGHPVLQFGEYWSIQGQSQHININNLIGDEYTRDSRSDTNALLGLGYYIDGQEKSIFKLIYGINAFYFAKTGVSGTEIQENLFTNLSYSYYITHYPVYGVAEVLIHEKSSKYALSFDLGIGPNFMRTSNLQERALDGGVTIPNHFFSSKTTPALSAMTGFGIRFQNFLGSAPLNCAYRFFYLGQGTFSKNSDQLLSTLHTGRDYAHALICSITT